MQETPIHLIQNLVYNLKFHFYDKSYKSIHLVKVRFQEGYSKPIIRTTYKCFLSTYKNEQKATEK